MKSKLIFSFGSSIFTIIITFVAIAFLTKTLSIEEFAVVASILVFYSFISIFDIFRVPSINLLLQYKRLKDEIIKSLFSISLVTSTSVSLLTFFFSYFLDLALIDIFLVTSSVFLFLCSPFLWTLLDSENLVEKSAVIRAMSQSSLYLTLIICTYFSISNYYSLFVSALIQLFGMFLFVPNKEKLLNCVLHKNSSRRVILNILSKSMSVFYHYVCSTVLANFERFICYLSGGPAMFAVATAFTELTNKSSFLARVINLASFPSIKLWNSQGLFDKSRKYLKAVDTFYFIVLIVTIAIGWIFQDFIISTFFSTTYLEYTWLFLLCLFSGVVRIFNYQSTLRLNGLGDFYTQSKFSTLSIVTAVLLISFNWEKELIIASIFALKIIDLCFYIYSIRKYNCETM